MINIQKGYKIIQRHHQSLTLLSNISLQVEKGEFVAIVGKSGGGKSTLLNAIGLIDSWTSGTYTFDDINMMTLTSDEQAHFRNATMGYIFQRYHLISSMTVLENVVMPLGYAGVKKHKRDIRGMELLKKVGLAQRANDISTVLSGGEMQRVAIARALANRPKVLLADEPTGALDSQNGQVIMELLYQLNREGTTILMVTHDLELTNYANRIVEMSDGILKEKVL